MSFFGFDLIELIQLVGYTGLTAVVFAETGLFLGFFLPGDSLLFIAGFLAAQGVFNIFFLIGLLWTAAILGNIVGYEFGRRVGPKLFYKDDSLLFKKAHALKAQAFYEKYGAKTLFLARFMPIVRTFAPIVAGVAKMDFKAFLFYSVTGATAWVVGLTVLGYYLGALTFVREHLEAMILFIIFLSILPGIISYLKERKLAKTTPPL
jgi:membrane-associated protein